jgi:hypothetical protein
MLISKILITVLVVLGLAYIAERISAKVAGVLAGYPLGIAIVLVFLGLEQGVEFASEAARYAILGLLANLALALCYWYMAKQARQVLNVGVASMVGLAGFLFVAYALQGVPQALTVTVPFTLVGLLVAAVLMLKMPAVAVQTVASLSTRDIFFRALVAAGTVVLITGLAELIGPVWAGLLSGFPVVAFPLFLILHYHHGKSVLTNSMRVYPLGLISLLVYTASVSLAYPYLGLLWGTLLGFLLASVYILLLPLMQKRLSA